MKLSEIKRLVVFGDSNTFGQGLSDIIDSNTPSNLCWASNVARHYGWELHNKAIPGSGNDSILRNIHEYVLGPYSIDKNKVKSSRFESNFLAGDFVIVGLSSATRMEIHLRSNHQYNRFYPNMSNNEFDNIEYKKLYDSYVNFTTSISDEFFAQKTLQDLHTMQSMFRVYNIPYLLFHAIFPLKPVSTKFIIDDRYFTETLQPLVKSIDNNFWVRHVMCSYLAINYGSELFLKCRHANEEGHKYWSNFLIEHLERLKSS